MNKTILFVTMMSIFATITALHRPSQSCVKTFSVTFHLEQKTTKIIALSFDDLRRQIMPIYSYKLEYRGKPVTCFDNLKDNDHIDILPVDWRTINLNIIGRSSDLSREVIWVSSLYRLKEAALKLFESNETVKRAIRAGKIFYQGRPLTPEIWDTLNDFVQLDIVEI